MCVCVTRIDGALMWFCNFKILLLLWRSIHNRKPCTFSVLYFSRCTRWNCEKNYVCYRIWSSHQLRCDNAYSKNNTDCGPTLGKKFLSTRFLYELILVYLISMPLHKCDSRTCGPNIPVGSFNTIKKDDNRIFTVCGNNRLYCVAMRGCRYKLYCRLYYVDSFNC